MSHRFNPSDGLIIVRTRISGPSERIVARLALDTGGTSTMVNPAFLRFVGYDPATSTERVRVTTGSGVEFVPRLEIDSIMALDLYQENFKIISHTLPPSASVDGLLGLDFFRGHRLSLDFVSGEVILD